MDQVTLAVYRAAAKAAYKGNAPRALHAAGINLCKLAKGFAQDGDVVKPNHGDTLSSIATWIMENCSDEDIDAHVEALNGRERGPAQDEPPAFRGIHRTGLKTAQDQIAFDRANPDVARIRTDPYRQPAHECGRCLRRRPRPLLRNTPMSRKCGCFDVWTVLVGIRGG